MKRRIITALLWTVWAAGALSLFAAVISIWVFLGSLLLLVLEPESFLGIGQEWWAGGSAAVVLGGTFAFFFLSLPTMGILQSDRRLRR